MKKTALCIFLLFCLLTASLAAFSSCSYPTVECDRLSEGQTKIMSFNVRRITYGDSGKIAWNVRKDYVFQTFQQAKPAIICLQEVTPQQYKDFKKVLKNYGSVITYRDATDNSEACPIFYYKTMYTLISTGTFWLSETPDVMSIDWDAEYYRICTYVVLRDNRSQKEFAVFNTHLDNRSEQARTNGFNLIADKINALGNYPAVIMGDFNAEEYTETYQNATANFFDVKYQVENDYRNSATYHGWGVGLDYDPIDYFFISKTGFAVDSFEVLTTTYDGAYASDHFPIVTKLTLTSSTTKRD